MCPSVGSHMRSHMRMCMCEFMIPSERVFLFFCSCLCVRYSVCLPFRVPLGLLARLQDSLLIFSTTLELCDLVETSRWSLV